MVVPPQNEQEDSMVEASERHNEPVDDSLDASSSSAGPSKPTTDSSTIIDGIGNNDDKPSATTPSLDIRQTIGSGTHLISDIVNENLIAVRYAALVSIGLLAAYGISQTPLFFRYRTVSEIPSRLFTTRKTITGRLMVCNDTKSSSKNNNTITSKNSVPVTCFVRHLSPMERLLSKSWLDWLLKIHPAATLRRERPEQSPHELLRVQIAGIVYPTLPEPKMSSSSSSSIRNQISIRGDDLGTSRESFPEREWLQKLAEQRLVVKCQLIGREVPIPNSSSNSNKGRSKRAIPGLLETTDPNNINNNNNKLYDNDRGDDAEQQVAVAYVHYYPKRHPLLGKDLGETMVKFGRAVASQDAGLYAHTATEQVVDATKDITTLRKDVSYMERLERAEYEACNGSYGVWADPNYRENRRDVVEEVEFQQKASVFRKAWRWLRR